MTTVSIVFPSRSLKRYLAVWPRSATRLRCGVTLLKVYDVSSSRRVEVGNVRIAPNDGASCRQNHWRAWSARNEASPAAASRSRSCCESAVANGAASVAAAISEHERRVVQPGQDGAQHRH